LKQIRNLVTAVCSSPEFKRCQLPTIEAPTSNAFLAGNPPHHKMGPIQFLPVPFRQRFFKQFSYCTKKERTVFHDTAKKSYYGNT